MDKKKTRNLPNARVVDGIPEHHPHEEFARQDALFKKARGAKD